MRVLFIHQNLPGQFKHLIRHFLTLGWDVTGVGESRRLRANVNRLAAGVRWVGYELPPAPAPNQALATTTFAVRRAACVARTLRNLRQSGQTFDLIVGHQGWGELMFVKDIYPNVPVITYAEFYYRNAGQDFGFDPEFPPSELDHHRLRVWNMHHLLSLDQADAAVSPTQWQRSRFPKEYQSKIRVIHEGVDTNQFKPDPATTLSFRRQNGDMVKLSRSDEVITFVARNLEPYRGFHSFMRALPKLLAQRPKARVVIVGADGASYGKRPTEGSYRSMYTAEVASRVDFSRIHFMGPLPYHAYRQVLQLSTAHVYLTYPFVLSWSMLEAMSAGCAIVGSRTAPVQEVITDRENGVLCDFFSSDSIVESINLICDAPALAASLRESARRKVCADFDVNARSIPQFMQLATDVLNKNQAVATQVAVSARALPAMPKPA